jgi:hypothetical protein
VSDRTSMDREGSSKSVSDDHRHMDTLSRVMVRSFCESPHGTRPEDLESLHRDLFYVARLTPSQLNAFVELANSNHVIVRALTMVQNAAVALGVSDVAEWCEDRIRPETVRIEHAVKVLHSICDVLEARNCSVVVIKSLDHWPDLGSDLDLYTTAAPAHVEAIMRDEFGARPVDRSWGDRLANKWNYRVPGLQELVEIHVQFLGQTGEHSNMAKRVVDRRVRKSVGGLEFHVPAPEERIVISALQRVYRHFYYRLCDMIDMSLLLQNQPVDFAELRRAADVAGIWPGVATFLFLIQTFVKSYGGDLVVPKEVVASAHDRNKAVEFGNGFLRVSKLTAAGLYGSQLAHATRQRDMRALLRLPLLPPLAVSALVAHRITGNDKGIW